MDALNALKTWDQARTLPRLAKAAGDGKPFAATGLERRRAGQAGVERREWLLWWACGVWSTVQRLAVYDLG